MPEEDARAARRVQSRRVGGVWGEPEGPPILEVRHLVKHFAVGGRMFGGAQGLVRAVDDVSFAIPSGGTLGLVGESGCGKTTTGRDASASRRSRVDRPT